MRTWSKFLSLKVSPESKWLWVRSFGVCLAVAPSVFYLSLLPTFMDAEMSTPFHLEGYLVVSLICIVLGYFCMRRGFQEEEKQRIRTVLREVLKEFPAPGKPPSESEVDRIKDSWSR